MKNKNKTAHELLKLVLEVREAKNDGRYDEFASAYATGTLISIMDSALRRVIPLQEGVDLSYDAHEAELDALKMKNLQKVANQSKLEELYA